MVRRLAFFPKQLGRYSCHLLVAVTLVLSLSWLSGCSSHDRSAGGGSAVTLVKTYLAEASAPEQELNETWPSKLEQIKYLCFMGLYSDGSVQKLDCTWNSDKPKVVSVEDGAVTAKSPGSANITASGADGQSATIVINVTGGELSSLNCINYETGAVVSGAVNVKLDQEVDFIAGGTYTDGEQSQVEGVWSSSDESIATVSGQGEPGVVTIHGKSKGTATIYCTCLNKTAEIQVEVVDDASAPTTESITFGEAATVDLIMSNITPPSKQLTVTARMSDGTEQTIVGQYCEWSSSDTGVATVATDGTVTGVGLGMATITCKYDGQEAECVVTVQTGELQSIYLNPDEVSLVLKKEGQVLKAVAVYSGNVEEDLKPADCTWHSSEPDVATVANDGTVTAVAKGSTVITCAYGGKYANCAVEVSNGAVSSIGFNKSSISVDAEANSEKLTASATFENGEIEQLDPAQCTWESTHPEVASVGNDGTIDFLLAGETDIVCTYQGVSGTCKVTVTKDVKSVALEPASLSVDCENTAAFTKITVTYTDTSTEVVNLDQCEWSSDKLATATVDKGVVTGVYPGNATITCKYGGKETTAAVTVTGKALDSISLSDTDISRYIGGPGAQTTITISVTGNYSDTSTASVPAADCAWSTSNAAVATVSNGVITPVHSGNATITCDYKGKTATVAVNLTWNACTGIYADPNSLDLNELTPEGDIALYAKYVDESIFRLQTSDVSYECDDKDGYLIVTAKGDHFNIALYYLGNDLFTFTFYYNDYDEAHSPNKLSCSAYVIVTEEY